MARKFPAFILVSAVFCLLISAYGDGPTFRADYIFKGSSLSQWKTLGQADWKAQDGEIIGTAKQPSGGWLILNKSFENAAFYSNVHCTSPCKAGVLLRATKTPDGGLKGVYLSLTDGDIASYELTLDANGAEVSRDKLAAGGGEAGAGAGYVGGSTHRNQQGIPPGPSFAATGGGAARGRGRGGRAPVPVPEGVTIPPGLERPTGGFNPGEWNQIEVILYGESITPRFNGGTLGGNVAGGKASEDFARYGPIALYVGGSGEADFKDLRYSDLNKLDVPKQEVSKNFRMQQLSNLYYSWSAQIADVNHDGVPDVIAGPYYYLGPDYTEAHEIYPPEPYNPGLDYAQSSMVSLAYDFTGDGWPDVLVMSGNAGNGTGTLYVNPRGESRDWDHYVVLPHVGNEETLLKDIDGDGKPEIIHAMNNQLCYSKPDPENPTGPWITKAISEVGPWGVNIGHGLGVGDINGDGRMDFINAYGWWEQPPKGSTEKYWTYHPQAFGRWGHYQGGAGGAEIGVYDVNGDGLNDVVTVLEGHGFGLAWYEQKRDAQGNISWVQHTIMDNFLTENAGGVIFTEPHSIAFADMDGDGIPDLVTGKRVFSHLFTFSDPDPFGPGVLYLYHTVRDPSAPGGAKFVPELIHNRSGVGSHFALADLNGDGTPDVVTSGVYGTFIFFNETKKSAAKSASGKRPQ